MAEDMTPFAEGNAVPDVPKGITPDRILQRRYSVIPNDCREGQDMMGREFPALDATPLASIAISLENQASPLVHEGEVPDSSLEGCSAIDVPMGQFPELADTAGPRGTLFRAGDLLSYLRQI